MKLIDIDKNLAKKYLNSDTTILVCKLIPYKNNTAIKAYTEDGEPIGDVEDSFIKDYLNEESVVLFINEEFDDETGLFEIVIQTMV